MKKIVSIVVGILSLCALHIATVYAAPTSTVVQNLFITNLASSPTSSLVIGANGLVSTSTIGGMGKVGPATSTYVTVFNASGTIIGYASLIFNSSTQTLSIGGVGGLSIAGSNNAGGTIIGNDSNEQISLNGGQVIVDGNFGFTGSGNLGNYNGAVGIFPDTSSDTFICDPINPACAFLDTSLITGNQNYQFPNSSGILCLTTTCTGGSTTTINGVDGPLFTFSIVGTSSPSSITTSSANLFLNLLRYASGTDINVSATSGVINFVNPGFITTSTNNFGGLTNASITAVTPITWNISSSIGFNTSTPLTISGIYTFNKGLVTNSTTTFNSSTPWTANTVQDGYNNNLINPDISLGENVGTDTAILGDRPNIGIPVPLFTPYQANQNIAFDIFPKGPTIANGFGNSIFGAAWEDICDSDLYNFSTSSYECLHLGKSLNGFANVSTEQGGNGVVTPLILNANGGNVAVGTNLSTPTSTLTVNGTFDVEATTTLQGQVDIKNNLSIGTTTTSDALDIVNTAALNAISPANIGFGNSNSSLGIFSQIVEDAITSTSSEIFVNFTNPSNNFGGNWLAYRFGGSNNKWFFGDDGSNAYFDTTHAMYFSTNLVSPNLVPTNPGLVIATNNQVSINTSTTKSEFYVNGSSTLGGTINTLITPNSFIATDGSGNLISTTTPIVSTGTAFNYSFWNSGGTTLSNTSAIHSVGGNVGIGATTAANTLTVSGGFQLLTTSSTIVTPSIGGAIVSGGCDSATSSVDSTISSSTTSFITTPTSNPGTTVGGTWAYTYLSAAGQITTNVCANITVTPNSIPYVVKIIR